MKFLFLEHYFHGSSLVMERPHPLAQIKRAFRTHPIAAILGPRQCGKSTLARLWMKAQGSAVETTFFDLENPTHLARLENPMLSLGELKGYVILDEIQRRPQLFEVLRVLADRPRPKTRFLILGSASPDLLRQSSESLAGRIAYIELTPFTLTEVIDVKRLWLRGGFPPAYLARSNADSVLWRDNYIATFLERDLPNLGIRVAPAMLRRFWSMITHYHGNVLNQADLGKSLTLSNTAVRRYVDILTGTFMLRQLLPWHANLKKRQVKAPKIYFRDSGLLHSLMGVPRWTALNLHPRLGASWEGFVLEEIIRRFAGPTRHFYFWATHQGAELDLLLEEGGQLIGVEIKFSDAPTLTKSMRIALDDLKLKRLWVVYPGRDEFPLAAKVRAIGLPELLTRRAL